MTANLPRIDGAEVARVCQELVRINTTNPPGNEEQAARYVADYLQPAGFQTQFVPLADGRSNLVARLKGTAQGQVGSLVFNGHLDVVGIGAQPWRFEPFAGEVAEGKVWGRGSSDMKGGVAAMLVAARAIAEMKTPLAGDLLVVTTADEEDTMGGARQIAALPDLGPLQAFIISEPTDNTLGLAERGALVAEITTYGKTAHGSTPHLGVNAVLMMVALVPELQRLELPFKPHPVLGDFSRSINTIHGGLATNVVPDRCVLTVDLRTVPGQDHRDVIRRIRELLERMSREVPGFRATVTEARDLPPAETSADEPAVAAFARAVEAATGKPAVFRTVRFATEACIFVPALGTPSLIFGPGDPALAHQPDEHVAIAKLEEAARVYAAAALGMLA